jgi:hypothetical protein
MLLKPKTMCDTRTVWPSILIAVIFELVIWKQFRIEKYNSNIERIKLKLKNIPECLILISRKFFGNPGCITDDKSNIEAKIICVNILMNFILKYIKTIWKLQYYIEH